MKSETSEQLLKTLEGLATETSKPMEKRLMDTAIWFHHNKDAIPKEELGKKVEFLTKTLDIMLELIAMHVQRQQMVEGHKSNSLWIPNGIVDRNTGKKYSG